LKWVLSTLQFWWKTEADLLRLFGRPLEKDAQNEYWLSASAYLSYGGVLRVVKS